jgi:hypothetical protein
VGRWLRAGPQVRNQDMRALRVRRPQSGHEFLVEVRSRRVAKTVGTQPWPGKRTTRAGIASIRLDHLTEPLDLVSERNREGIPSMQDTPDVGQHGRDRPERPVELKPVGRRDPRGIRGRRLDVVDARVIEDDDDRPVRHIHRQGQSGHLPLSVLPVSGAHWIGHDGRSLHLPPCDHPPRALALAVRLASPPPDPRRPILDPGTRLSRLHLEDGPHAVREQEGISDLAGAGPLRDHRNGVDEVRHTELRGNPPDVLFDDVSIFLDVHLGLEHRPSLGRTSELAVCRPYTLVLVSGSSGGPS